jgi:uncharacterized protein (TIGR02444 family)
MPPPEIADPRSLWSHALRTYAVSGVAECCLRLQDEHQLDVDVLLAILWLADRGVELDEVSLEQLLNAASPARVRVLHLRALRRAVGAERTHDPRWAELYPHLKAMELAAERVELTSIEDATANLPPTIGADAPAVARRGLALYAARANRRDAEVLLDHLVACLWTDA